EVWYQFDFASAGTWTVGTTGSTDTIGTVYASNGSTVLASNDDAGGTLNFSITLNVPSGGRYYVRVTGFANSTGAYTLVSSFTTTLTCPGHLLSCASTG